MTFPVKTIRKFIPTVTLDRVAPISPVFRLLAISLTIGLIICGKVLADDVPAATQKVGDHSVISTEDGGIRDDELVDFICQKINENGGKVKDVKVMAAACFGGGLLDDFQREFGPGGACEGIPWVGASASAHDEMSLGKGNKTVAKYADEDEFIGSAWTDALSGISHFNLKTKAGVIRNGSPTNHVLLDFKAAAQNDWAGPNGKKIETPTVASGNNGDEINWRAPIGQAWGHEAIVFGGSQTHLRHISNVWNMTASLNEVWKGKPHNIQTIDGGTRQDLFDAIATSAERLDENTQLVIYINDHGGTLHDFGESNNGNQSILIEEPTTFQSNLSQGLFQGLWGNFFALDPPSPILKMDISDCSNCSSWWYFWNGYQLDFPSGNPTGPVSLPIPLYKIYPGMNYLEVVPQSSSQKNTSESRLKAEFGQLELSNLELNSGAMNDLESDQVLLPAQSAAYFDSGRSGEGIFVELLDNGKAIVYVFTYPPDGKGQSWMLGIGDQLGSGIVVKQMFLPTGPSFGPGFDPGELVMNPFGGLSFGFPSCGTNDFTGILNIPPGTVEGYDELLLDTNYSQLAEIIDCQTGERSANSGFSGSWYDPSHNGEGIILEVLKNGSVIVQWFTFDKAGKQMWVQGTGTITAGVLTVNNLFTTAGTAYGAGFDPQDVTQIPWGTLTMEFMSCSEVTLKYNSSAGFGSGTLNMTKLTRLMGIPCEDQG